MADVKKCDETCGCPVPCSLDTACKCSVESGNAASRHATCTCGEHCSCNPCSCGKVPIGVQAGKGSCSCGSGCNCEKCSC
uniref:Metallothionein n=1 Tax=Xerophyta humilis TaxID=211604 RepID=Q6J9F7_9LILI|nr:metallothionein [Xerophyta humilis]